MGIELTGKIIAIFETKQITERFTKREFVVETLDNPKYPQPILFQMTGDRCAQLDEFQVGDSVRLDFSVRGREYTKGSETKYFNSLDVWKVERHGKRESPNAGRLPPPATHSTVDTHSTVAGAAPDDDIPFATCDLGAEPSPIAMVLR